VFLRNSRHPPFPATSTAYSGIGPPSPKVTGSHCRVPSPFRPGSPKGSTLNLPVSGLVRFFLQSFLDQLLQKEKAASPVFALLQKSYLLHKKRTNFYLLTGAYHHRAERPIQAPLLISAEATLKFAVAVIIYTALLLMPAFLKGIAPQ
jgi:hypothetical protein